MNRHNQRLTNFRITDEEVISSIYRGNGEWMAIGEYMNKSKKMISTIKYSIINL
jgi:hypothetical protein